MDKKYEQLTIVDVFILEKLMLNQKLGRRLMERIMGTKIRHIVCPTNNIVIRKDGTRGIYMEVHMSDGARSVQRVKLFLCAEDKFNRGYPIYRFRETCIQAPELKLEGGIEQIFVAYTEDLEEQITDKELKAILYYMKDTKDKRTNLIKMIDDEIRRIKRNGLFRKEYEALQRQETELQQHIYAQTYKTGKKNCYMTTKT